jgi:hypothetical protein
VFALHQLKVVEVIQRSVPPRYDCARCHPRWNPEQDLENGCPKCPLTMVQRTLWTGAPGRLRGHGLYEEWEAFIGEGDPREELPALSAALSAVVDAIAALPEGQQVDPRWSPEFAALVEGYWQAVRTIEREQRYEAAQDLAALKAAASKSK